jgi:DNA mismatch repair protein MutL
MAENLITIPQRNGVTTINGLIGTPAAARSSAKWQYVFLNGRFIRDRLINHAIKEGYRGRLMPTRCPVVFIFINIDPEEVDVNVHPTKIEVRFRNSNGVYGDVLAALKETLNRANLTPDISTQNFADELAAGPDPFGEPQQPTAAEQNKASLREALADFFKTAPAPQQRLDFPATIPQYHGYRAPQVAPRPVQDFSERFETPANMPAAPADEIYELTAPPATQQPLLQIHNTYIVSQTDEGLSIVDQHALHERINYNDLKRRLAEGNLTKQRMLIPQTINVTPEEAALLEDAGELLATLGFEIEPFGPGTYAIQQYPTLLAQRSVRMTDFLRELIDTLREDETADAERMLEKVLAMMACKASIKAGDPLSEDEMRQLLDRAAGIDKANACPHGRPTTLNITLKELEKSFKRI